MVTQTTPEGPSLNSIVHVKLKVPHLISRVTKTQIGAANRASGPGAVETFDRKTHLPAGHAFEGRLTGHLTTENGGIVYFRVEDQRGREWYLDTTVADLAPVRLPGDGGGK